MLTLDQGPAAAHGFTLDQWLLIAVLVGMVLLLCGVIVSIREARVQQRLDLLLLREFRLARGVDPEVNEEEMFI